MRAYVHGNWSPELLQVVARAGHDVAVLDASMTPEEIYQEVLVADAILIQHSRPDIDLGVVLGLALAFGKDIYVVYAGPPSAFLRMDGVRVHIDIESALADLLEAFAEAVEEEQGDEHMGLHGPGAGPGDDTDQRGP